MGIFDRLFGKNKNSSVSEIKNIQEKQSKVEATTQGNNSESIVEFQKANDLKTNNVIIANQHTVIPQQKKEYDLPLIIANKGAALGIVDEVFFTPIVLTVIITAITTPVFLKLVFKEKSELAAEFHPFRV